MLNLFTDHINSIKCLQLLVVAQKGVQIKVHQKNLYMPCPRSLYWETAQLCQPLLIALNGGENQTLMN